MHKSNRRGASPSPEKGLSVIGCTRQLICAQVEVLNISVHSYCVETKYCPGNVASLTTFNSILHEDLGSTVLVNSDGDDAPARPWP